MRRFRLPALAFLVTSGAVAAPPRADHQVRTEALAVYRILHRQDWAALREAGGFSQAMLRTLPSGGEAFAQEVTRGIGGGRNQEMVDRMLGGLVHLEVGEALIHGDYAALPTTCTLDVEGRKRIFKGSMHLIRRGDAWKWDLTFSDDLQEALSKALAELIGSPADAHVVVK